VAEPIDTDLTGPSAAVPLAAMPDPRTREWRFPSTAMSVRRMRHELRPFLTGSGLPEAEIDDLVLAACEAATNGIDHAQNPAEPFFDVEAEVDTRRIRIVVRDYGRWTTGRIDHGNRGRGLHMMTALAAVSLTSRPSGTWVTLRNLVDGRPTGQG
jgi:anti-sigma regulatory factor (Ser/Thr protein kinase)